VSRQGPTPNPFTYNGRDGVVDDGSGLYFMRTRYYAPELMRFTQKDQRGQPKLDDPQSLNRYAYVKGDPVRFVDPNGDRWTEEDTARLSKIGIGAIPYVGTALGLWEVWQFMQENRNDWQEEDTEEVVKLLLGNLPYGIGDAISLFFLAADEAREMVEDWATTIRSQTIKSDGASITYGEFIDQCLRDPECKVQMATQMTTLDFWKRILSPESPIFPPAPENSPAGPSAPNP
jgi:RHS repeat-associated protein